MLCHGPVRVPEDARLGPAKIRCEMPEESAFRSFATDIPVTITAGKRSL